MINPPSFSETIDYLNKVGAASLGVNAHEINQLDTKYGSRASNLVRENVGDLTVQEQQSIQKHVDEWKIDVVLVGSVTIGKRLGVGTSNPIGHGDNTKSDIDYIIPDISVKDYFTNPFESPPPHFSLPCFDTFQGLNFGNPHVHMHRIWFKPHMPPVLLRPGKANLPLVHNKT